MKLVPVFPLPSVVFFPSTVLPLHVFEPRYIELVRDAMAGEGEMAVSLLRGSWQAESGGSPEYHPIGSVGRIEDLERLPDGRFILRLVGLQRIELGPVAQERPYRIVEMVPRDEAPLDETDEEVRSRKLDLLVSHGCLLQELHPGDEHPIVMNEQLTVEAAINGACASLPVDPSIRQSLLEENDLRRRLDRVIGLLDETLQRVMRLKALRGEDDGGSLLN